MFHVNQTVRLEGHQQQRRSTASRLLAAKSFTFPVTGAAVACGICSFRQQQSPAANSRKIQKLDSALLSRRPGPLQPSNFDATTPPPSTRSAESGCTTFRNTANSSDRRHVDIDWLTDSDDASVTAEMVSSKR
jgi:hypothetical protein